MKVNRRLQLVENFCCFLTFSILNVPLPVQVYGYALFLNPMFLFLPSPTSHS